MEIEQLMKIIGTIGQAFFFVGLGIFLLGLFVANYNWYFLIPGGLLGGIGAYIIWFLDKKEVDSTIKEYEEWRDKLISTGIMIEVPTNQCEVKSNSYIRDKGVDFNSLDTDVNDAVFGKNYTVLDGKDQNVVLYSTVVNGEEITFISPIIYKESNTLEFLLASRPSTKLFVDRLNKSNFYWDLEFLREN